MNDPTKLRRFCFSLRALLIFTALACVLMGWIANQRGQSRQDLLIAEKLKSHGATVILRSPFDAPEPGRKLRQMTDSIEQSWWRRQLGSLLGPRVGYVSIRQPSFYQRTYWYGDTTASDVKLVAQLKDVRGLYLYVTLDALPPIANLRSLQTLDLNATDIADLTLLVGLTKLREINLNHTEVVNLKPLAEFKKLQSLHLNYTRVSDLTPLAAIQNLHDLFLDGTDVSDIRALGGLKSLAWLYLYKTSVIDLTPLAKLTNLEYLDLSSTQVRDLTPLHGLKNLKWLDVKKTQANDAHIDLLQRALPNCKITR